MKEMMMMMILAPRVMQMVRHQVHLIKQGSSNAPDSDDTDTTSIVTTGTGTKLISRPVTFCKGNE